jgi:hypothetical protein
MVLTPAKCSEISKKIEIYKLSAGTFGYDMVIQDRTARMLGKLQVKFVSNFQISMFFLSIYLLLNGNITRFLSFHLFIVDVWWENYGRRVPKLQKLVIRVLIQTCSSSGCKCNCNVFEKIYSKKRNMLEMFKLFIYFL